jgi:acyl-CoA synthetase (AMP-forming)/AMP-acid ligase II
MIGSAGGQEHAVAAGLSIVSGVQYFGRAAATAPAWSDDRVTLTFGALHERTDRAAAALVDLGICDGRHVALLLENQAAYAEAIAGVAKAGAVLVPVTTQTTGPELAEILERSSAGAVITQRRFLDVVASAASRYEPDHIFSVDAADDARPWSALVDGPQAASRLPQLDEAATFCVSFTGGTTGRPKGVMLSHRSRALTFHYMALDFGLGPGRRVINATPLSHGAGLAYGYGFMTAGAHVHTMRRWDPEHLLSLLRAHPPDQMFFVPSQLADLRSLGTKRLRAAGFHRMATAFSTAAPLPDDIKEWFVGDLPEVTFADVYGGTEAGVVSVLKTPELQRRERCAGTPWFMTEVRILDGDGNDVPQGQSGDLYSRSPYVFSGYLDDPEQTREVMTDDGFVTAGDVAVQDPDGYLYIVDRSKDLIISGGVNVYPREIEEVLLRHPTVADAAVVGVPHARWGEEVVAIVAAAGDDPIDGVALLRFCRESLSSIKVPKKVLVRQSLDRTDTGKLAKSQLRAWASEQLSTERT